MDQLDPKRLQQLIEGSGLSYKKNSTSYLFTCPRCGQDKLALFRDSGYYICHKCHDSDGVMKGRAEYALSDLLQLPVAVVREQLYGASSEGGVFETPPDFFQGPSEQAEDEEVFRPPAIEWPFDVYPLDHTYSARGVAYLEGRGIPMAIAQEYGIRYCPAERRVYFPIEVGGRLVGYQKRLIVPNRAWNEEAGKWFEAPKILSSKDIPRDRTLMFGDRLKGSEHAILCEGPVDALMTHLCHGGNVATMGKAVSSGQLELIRKSGVRRVYLALDPDAAGVMNRLVQELSDFELFLLRPPEGVKDLGELSMEAVYELFLQAPRLTRHSVFVYFGGK